jgi:NAD(P)-dependent dehydrogenase (short-subunit alcohol dehydrogenase family)
MWNALNVRKGKRSVRLGIVTNDIQADLSNQVAVISGGSRGIGFAAAQQLGSLGATVVIVGRNPENLASAQEALVDQGIDALGICVDISDAQAVAQLVGGNPIAANADILINSAGVMSEKMAKTLRTTSQEWHRVMSINLDGTFNLISAIGPQMSSRRSGRIINVSACLGRFTGPGLQGGLAPYRISKAAVNALTKNLAAELGNGTRGVLVDAMCPNHTRTDMGGPDAPRSPQEAADTIAWLATRDYVAGIKTGLLWEDRQEVPW